MATIIPPGFSQIALHFGALSPVGSAPTTTFGVTGSPSDDTGDLVYAWWHEYYRPLQTSAIPLIDIVQTGATETFQTLVGEAGTGGAGGAPPQVSPLITLGTGLRGRANRGRMYWPSVLRASDYAGDGTLDSAVRASLLEAASELVAALHTAGSDMVILHTASSDPTPVDRVDVSGQIATQRRRNR